MKVFVAMVIIALLGDFCHCQSGEDDIEQPVLIGFTENEYSVRENEKAVTVTVAVLQGSLDNETTAIVFLHTQEDSAKASEDYEPISDHMLIFNATNLEHNVTITILEDNIKEDVEMFKVLLTNTTTREKRGAHFNYTGIAGVFIFDSSNTTDIGLAVGLGVGLPVTGLALSVTVPVLIYFYCKNKKNKVKPWGN